jgi:hypothetical protein
LRNPVFKSIAPNYRKRVLEIVMQEGRRRRHYALPFAVLPYAIDARNRFTTVDVDPDTGGLGVAYELADGSQGSFPSDFVLYYCDPAYDWSPVNQLKRAMRDEVRASKLSVRVLADALDTSPTQVLHLLEEENVSKQLRQLWQLARLVGYDLEIRLHPKH